MGEMARAELGFCHALVEGLASRNLQFNKISGCLFLHGNGSASLMGSAVVQPVFRGLHFISQKQNISCIRLSF